MESLIVLGIFAFFYFLPALLAWHRGVPHAGSVLVVNLFLGWTLIGWVVALAMAARSVPPGPNGAEASPLRQLPPRTRERR